MKNIHILPTDKPSRLVKFFTNKFHLCKEILPIQDEEQYQHIYITSNEKIKEGDWYLFKGEKLEKADRFSCNSLCKKIILTTDQDLIKDGVQAIDDKFLEWFILNPSCEEVEIIIEQYTQNYHKDIWYNKYKIIIPKEEPEQRLEKYSERFDNDKSPIGNPETWGKRPVIVWKPSLFQRFLYWIKLKKDPRYNGTRPHPWLLDEAGQWSGYKYGIDHYDSQDEIMERFIANAKKK